MTGTELGILAGGASLLILIPLLLRGLVLMLFAGLKVILIGGLIMGVVYLNDPIKEIVTDKKLAAQLNTFGEDKIHQLIADLRDGAVETGTKKLIDKVK